ncbi:nucleoside triphosphate hydrolase [Corynebacterium macginleyi]|uniref:MazG nucleotide pyrophosphohydrolase domain-containing protein n=1 Tax=Corynebacterium macginleyi TaxID=38290 RepID=UPI00190CB08E|nr:MazG nucleotide pyrophosphohydrolase domain-containing protein [Corynebacterium macginleyi]MBK4142319.1 nucleoside triphosphate hydrolase [Corynebacterium macginleyi]MBK4151014.1 nucleoside triphosphate hydrolase [Corynebacterium macginleyi]MBK4168289.1 nucleoside triphosphate hydrolase [Corynebacterium macginleyi]
MTVLLLDERWPTMIPMRAHSRLFGPVQFTGEVPVSVRWNFADLLSGDDATGTLVTTDEHDPETQARIATGEQVIRADSLDDPVMQARNAMATARRIGEWEREQTHESLLPYLEEEAGEFAAAVRQCAPEEDLLKELGDIFLQVIFHAEISTFSLDDVAASFVQKMRSRAPYLFDGTTEIVSVEEQNRLWAEGKSRE